jgi:hypothetical protein
VTRARLAALLALTVAALLAAPAADTAPAAGARSPWQLFPGARMDPGRPVLAIGWAQNRVWVVTPYNDVPILRSARLSGGRLASFAQTRVPTRAGRAIPIVDGRLVIEKAGTTKSNEYTLTVDTLPLLANGRFGAPKVVPDDLLARAKEAVPKVWSAGILDGVRVGDRVVWALLGAPECHSIGGCRVFFLACCSKSGAAVDLTRFVDQRENLFHEHGFLHIGRDARGRIWLAWLDNRDSRHAAGGYPRILELDGPSLAPRTDALAMPGVFATRVELACASSCRIVAETNPPLSPARVLSWAPGERSPTVVATAWHNKVVRTGVADLLAATYRSGHLVVAYHGEIGKTQYADTTIRQRIWVVRGDARGARARIVGELPYTEGWPPSDYAARVDSVAMLPSVYATFAPRGLVVVDSFLDTRRAWSPVIGAVVPLGR